MDYHGRGKNPPLAAPASFFMADIYDIFWILGLLLLSAGAYLAWPPAGLLVPGLVLTVFGMVGSATRQRNK